MALRVLFVENSIGVSGSTVSLCSLINHLDRRMFEPFVVVSKNEQVGYLREHLTDPIEVALIRPLIRLKESPLVTRGIIALERRTPTLAQLCSRVVAFLNLVVCTLPYCVRLYWHAKSRKISLVHHNNGFDVAANILVPCLRVPLVSYQRGDEWNSRLVRFLCRTTSKYIANSEATKKSLLDLGVAARKIVTIYPGIDTPPNSAGRSITPRREDFGLEPDTPCFGIFGMLLPWKGHKVFLRAAQKVIKELPKARAFIVGSCPEREATYECELNRMAKDLAVDESVIFTGFRHDATEMMRLMDVVVHASISPEPFGRVIVEAMSVSKPVVATFGGGPEEIIGNGRTGFLVPPGDETALAAIILKLLQDKKLAAEIGAAGHQEFLHRFSAGQTAARVKEVYAELIEESVGNICKSRLNF